jgi:O-antigen/teichoic acid export membrane protein
MSGDVVISGRTRGRRSASLLRNGLYNVGGQAVRGAAGPLTIPFLIRFLGIREYGVWSLAYAVLALMTLSEAGISVAAVVFLSKDFAKDDFREAGTTLTFILVSAVLLSIAVALPLFRYNWHVAGMTGPLPYRNKGGLPSVDCRRSKSA